MKILRVSDETTAVEDRYRGPVTGAVREYRITSTSVVVWTTSTASETYLKAEELPVRAAGISLTTITT